MLVLRPYVILTAGILVSTTAVAADCERLDGATIEEMSQKQMLETYCRAYSVALPPAAGQSSSDLPGTRQNTCLSNRGKLAEALQARYGVSTPQCSPMIQLDPHQDM